MPTAATPNPSRAHLLPGYRPSPGFVVILLLILSSALKYLWASTSIGSVDALFFYTFGRAQAHLTLGQMYATDAIFNHTPLTAWFVKVLAEWAGNSLGQFSFYLRLPCIVADAVVVATMVRFRESLGNPPWWALGLLALSPVSMMVSGFHANVDPILVMFLFLAAVACVKESPLICGVMLGLACSVKIVPVLFAPVFFFFWLARGSVRPFLVAAVLTGLAGFAPALLECPKLFLQNVFGYGSYWGVWGFPYFLRLTGWEQVSVINYRDFTPAQSLFSMIFRLTIIAGIISLAWRRRHVPAAGIFATLGGAWILFFTFATGVGVQYMVWLAPFVLLFSARYYVVLTGALSIFLITFYQLSSQGGVFPWLFCKPQNSHLPIWTATGVLPWLLFAGGLIYYRQTLWGSQPGAEVNVKVVPGFSGAKLAAEAESPASAVGEPSCF